MEPVRAGVPALIGPGCSNFADLVPPLVEAGCLEIADATVLGEKVLAALTKAPLRSGPKAPLPEALRGALDRTWDLIAPHLPPVG